jgi:hypothetical protein
VHDALYAELARGIVLPETGEGKDGWSFPLVNYLPVAPRTRAWRAERAADRKGSGAGYVRR